MGNIKSSLKTTNSTTTNSSVSHKVGVSSSAISRSIDKQIKADQKRMKREVKLLLLGRCLCLMLETSPLLTLSSL